EHFRIETEPLDSLLLEDNPARLTKERFKTALRVVERQPGKEPDKHIENNPGGFTKDRLMGCDQRPVNGARADCDVVTRGYCGQKLFGFLDGRGQIGIGEKCYTPACFEHAPPYAISLAAIPLIQKKSKSAIWGRSFPFLSDTRCLIGRAIVNDDDFQGIRKSWIPSEILVNARERAF